MDLSTIKIKITADTTQVEQSMNTMKQNVAGGLASVGGVMTAAITAPIAAAGKAIYETSSTFESSMAKLSAISGATGDDLLALEEKAKLMGRTTKFSATESADAMNFMAMAGWDATQIVDGLDGVMSLAAASGADLATASDILTDAMTAFGLSADEANGFADVLAATASASNTSVELLGETFKYVAPVAGAMGYSVEDASVAIGLMANAGIKGSQAGTTLKTALLNLASPTKAMQQEMDKYGVSLTDANGEMLGLDDVMGQLRTSFADVDEATQTAALSTIFGKESVAGMMAVINASDADFNKLTDNINNSSGAAENMAAIMGDTVEGKMANMQSAIEGLQLQFGEVLLPVIEKVVEWIANMVNGFTEFLEQNPWMAEVLAALATGLAVVGPLLLAVAAGFALVSLFSSPITLTILAIAAGIAVVVAAIILLVSNWEWLVEQLKAGISWIGEGFTWLIEQFNGWMASLGAWCQGVATWFSELWINMKMGASETWEGIKQSIGGSLEGIKTLMTTSWESIKTNVANTWAWITGLITTAWENIKNVISSALNWIKGWIDGKWAEIKTIFSNSLTWIKDKVWGIFETIKTNISDAMNGIWNEVVEMWENIKNVFKNPIKAVVDFVSGGDKKAQQAAGYGLSNPGAPMSARTLGEGEINLLTDGYNLGMNALMFGATPRTSFQEMVKEIKSAQQSKEITNVNEEITINLNVGSVRNDSDIRKISSEMDKLRRQNFRSGGRTL